MAMAQAVLGGRGLHLQCFSTSTSLRSVRHLSAAGSVSVGSSRVSSGSSRYVQLIKASGGSEKNDKPKSQGGTRLLSIALPILATIVVTKSTDTYYNDSIFIDTQNDWMMPEEMTKNLYMLFAMVFSWGCCVFGSMNDPFYESDEYRGPGGNGTNHWIYEREEALEQEAREELFREALVKEIEGKVGEMRELEQGADKEKELV
ncbi:hypothetical protein KC19_VG205000 [Ceratodon purpureus]|uniref:Uncharacterized protein n=1 Tax=Ceratodon purpureus TaxID=3225 RepID=A0A8T0HSC2_CERPU|nr:hypothetical protein KC19_VG205000 [Ceratodon purpureus]